jgi:hypothetical protein
MIRLFSLAIRHGFYNDAGGVCEDLAIDPAPDCALLMRRLGITFHNFGADAVIGIAAERMLGLIDWLGRKAPAARLAFTLTPRAPGFPGITDLPWNDVARRRKLYVTNMATAMLGAGPIRLGGTEGVSASMLRAATDILKPAAPRAIGLVDLLLTQPAPGIGDPLSYPVAADGAVTPVALELRFAARATCWRYHVMAMQGRLGDSLTIAGTGACFERSVAQLPGGTEGAVYIADTPLPLRRRSPYRFSLTGERRDGNGRRAPIHVACLPVAPASPVWPADTGDPGKAFSDIYVYV